jgi:hypothetical protein
MFKKQIPIHPFSEHLKERGWCSWKDQNPDENVEHYKKKLLKLYEKFKPFLNDE